MTDRNSFDRHALRFLFPGGCAGAAWRCSPPACPACSATRCCAASPRPPRPATRPPPPRAAPARTLRGRSSPPPARSARRRTAKSGCLGSRAELEAEEELECLIGWDRVHCAGRNNTSKCLPPPPAGHSCAADRLRPFKLQQHSSCLLPTRAPSEGTQLPSTTIPGLKMHGNAAEVKLGMLLRRTHVVLWQYGSSPVGVSQKPHFGCNEAHCVSLHCMGCGSARSLIGDFTLLRESSTPVIESVGPAQCLAEKRSGAAD